MRDTEGRGTPIERQTLADGIVGAGGPAGLLCLPTLPAYSSSVGGDASNFGKRSWATLAKLQRDSGTSVDVLSYCFCLCL